jgi:hypothetical protein
MSAKAWRFLFWGGLSLGLTAAIGCSSEEDPVDGGKSGTAGTASGSAGKGGSGGSAGSGVAGSTSGGAGTGSGGQAGTSGAGGTVAGSAGTAAGSAGAGAGGAGAGGAGAGGAAAGSAGTAGSGGSAGDNLGGGGATAGTGGGGMAATLVEPIDRGSGDYVLELSDGLFFKINAAGARIMDVHLGSGENLLTGSSINDVNYGSTFWTSPQTDWSWPRSPRSTARPTRPRWRARP